MKYIEFYYFEPGLKKKIYLFVCVAVVVGEAKRPFLTNLALVNVNLVGVFDSDKKGRVIIIDKHCGKIKQKSTYLLFLVSLLLLELL